MEVELASATKLACAYCEEDEFVPLMYLGNFNL